MEAEPSIDGASQAQVVSRDHVETIIRDAFTGARLGDGLSLGEAEAASDLYRTISPEQSKERRSSEVKDDWAAVPQSELERDDIALLDPRGLRYYLPALMLSLLDHYDRSEMWCIGTIAALDQRDPHPIGFMSLLSAEQKRAIALYVKALPELVRLDAEDTEILIGAFRDVWAVELASDE